MTKTFVRSLVTNLEDAMREGEACAVMVQNYAGSIWIKVDREREPCLVVDFVDGIVRLGIYHEDEFGRYEEPQIITIKRIKKEKQNA